MRINAVKLFLPDTVIKEVEDVLHEGNWVDGKKVKSLEKHFAEYCDVKYCRAVNSGTSALMVILGALGIGVGDEVIVPSFSFIATANAVLFTGAKPVFADVDPQTFNLNPESVLEKITKKTKAIMPVHLFGLCAEIDRLKEICEDMDIRLIEDACQAHGATYKGKKAGSMGIAGAFSLYPTKNMFCGGEGGLITTNDEDLYEKIKLFANHGQAARYKHEALGYNFRMQETNAVIAKWALENLDEWNESRNANARYYNKELADIQGIVTPEFPDYCDHVFHQYTIKTDFRAKLVGKFTEQEIGYGIYYPTAIHQQAVYKNLGYQDKLPVTEDLCQKVLSIPNHPFLVEEEKAEIVNVIREALKKVEPEKTEETKGVPPEEA